MIPFTKGTGKIQIKQKTVVDNSNKKNEDSDVSRVDMSYVFVRLRSLSTPNSIQRGKLAIYRELLDIVSLFEKDASFMKLYKNSDK